MTRGQQNLSELEHAIHTIHKFAEFDSTLEPAALALIARDKEALGYDNQLRREKVANYEIPVIGSLPPTGGCGPATD